MEVHKAELFYTDPNTKQEKTIIAEGKDEGDAAQNAVKRFKTFFPNLPVTCITRFNNVNKKNAQRYQSKQTETLRFGSGVV